MSERVPIPDGSREPGLRPDSAAGAASEPVAGWTPELGWTARETSPGQAGANAMTELVMRTFRLNGIFLTVGDALARPAGLTSARWQVIGAVLRQPQTVSGIAREMGLTRQSVQRLANEVVAQGFAEFRPNPAHRRAPLLEPTPAGRNAIATIGRAQPIWTQSIADQVGVERLQECVRTLNEVIVAASASPVASQT